MTSIAPYRFDCVRRDHPLEAGLMRLLLTCCCLFSLGQLLAEETNESGLETRLETTVRHLCDDAVPRNFRNIARLDELAGWIEAEFVSQGLAVEQQRYTVQDQSYCNVIASLGPGDAPRIIVGAHYDVAGEGPGADDNASGVAGLLALSGLLAPQAAQLQCRVDFVAFTLEEPPFFAGRQMGSAVHVRSLREQGVAVQGMICLEMIGFFSDAAASQRYPEPALGLLYPSVGNFIAVVSNPESDGFARPLLPHLRSAGINTQYLVAPANMMGVGLSDHRNYWQAGIPALMLSDTAFYRNPHYHHPSDRPETLDYRRMAQVVVGLQAGLLAMASAPVGE